MDHIKGHSRNRCGFGRTARAHTIALGRCIHRCTRMTLRRMTLTCRPITTRQTLLLSMILPLHRRCPLLHWPTSLALTPPHPAVPALAACPRSPHRSASVVGSRTRRTTRHETADGFACPLLRAKCPLLLCITPSTIKGHCPYLVYPTVQNTILGGWAQLR